MTRAERRRRRQRAINWWINLLFRRPGYGWSHENLWYQEPGRMAKRSTVCSCHSCKRDYWYTPERSNLQDALGEHEAALRKRNRIYRIGSPKWARRGGASNQHRSGKKVPGPKPKLVY